MNSLRQLLEFLDALESAHIQYRLEHNRNAIMVIIREPSSFLEIEFFEDGRVEMQTIGPPGEVLPVPFAGLIERIIRIVHGP